MPHPVLARPALPSPSRDRFLAFAFAAADLLVEALADGTIVFADGAFHGRFRRPASSYVGGALHDLVAAADHPALDLALAAARQHGRAPPFVVRLADAEGSRMAVSALTMPGASRLYVTFSQPVPRSVPAPERPGCSQEAVTAQGLLAACRPETLRPRGPAAGSNAGMDLDGCGLGPARAARALRLALGGLRDGGLDAVARRGLGEGLVAFITAADARIEATRAAIRERRFHLLFQPIVTLADRQVHHFEALLRPRSTPELAVRSVQEFVLFAEAAGLSEELDWAVLDTAAAASEAARGASVAVNVSGLSMQSSAFRDRMLDRLARATRAGANLLIELTETADIDDLGSAVASMAGLRAAGIPVCLDDFGSGSAAFRYLREFRVDYVKLDGSYVRGALSSAREHGFLLTMVELANFMGAKTVAETIETEEQARLMREIGIEFGQGYLFGRPAPLPGASPL